MRTQLVPQTSVGRLMSLNVDAPEYTRHFQSHHHQQAPQSPEIPALVPLSLAATANDDNGEKTMMWTNIADLFSKTDKHEAELHQCNEALTRSANDIIQELQEMKTELADVQQKQLLTTQVRKIKKYVNKKCEKLRENVTYGSFNADNEIFSYINKIRAEMDKRMTQLETENAELREELTALHQTYDNDYDMFVKRENDLMEKLDTAVQMTDALNQRVKDCEFTFARRIQEAQSDMEQSQYTLAGDLREEFARAITREIEFDSKTNVKLVQSVNDEMTELVTRSNEYHSHRFFGVLEELKNTRSDYENKLDTLKKSIGMVDAELSDTKEKVDFLTEEVAQASNDVYDVKERITETTDIIYRELDRDYYDLKDYVKRSIRRENKKNRDAADAAAAGSSTSRSLSELASNVIGAIMDPIQVIANEYADEKGAEDRCHNQEQHDDDDQDHVIIMDENMFRSDDSDVE
jgi:hypothetical protein